MIHVSRTGRIRQRLLHANAGARRGRTRGRRPTAALAPAQRVIAAARVVGVPVFLHPLQELQVVLETALDQPLHGHNFIDAVVDERLLQHLEVVHVFILLHRVKLDF